MKVQRGEAERLSDVVRILWPDYSLEELVEIINGYLNSDNDAIFAETDNGVYIAVAFCTLRRDYVEGCNTCPVGYLEGVCVREAYRHRGIARKLVAECEQWARENGCTEFASDCELRNTTSLNFHLSIGF